MTITIKWVAAGATVLLLLALGWLVGREPRPPALDLHASTTELIEPEAVLAEMEPELHSARVAVAATPTAAEPPDSATTPGVSILVVDPEGVPVAHADIWSGATLDSLASVGRADASGRLVLALTDQHRLVCARAAGWSSSPVFGARAGTEELVLQLPAPGVELVVLVRDPWGRPLPGARVFAGRRQEVPYRTSNGRRGTAAAGFEAATDERGIARPGSLAPGWFRLEVRHPRFAQHDGFHTAEPGAPMRLEVTLAEGFFAEGIVVDELGRPVADATLRSGARNGPRAWSDEHGAYRLGPLASGKVRVYGPAGTLAEGRLRGEPGDTVRWDPVLELGRVLRGKLFDADGRALEGHRIAACRDSGGGWRRAVVTASDGSFEIVQCPKTVRIEVFRTGGPQGLPLLVRRDVAPGGVGELVLRLPSSLSAVHGRIVWDAGAPPGAPVFLQHVADPMAHRVTAGQGVPLSLEDGRFSFLELAPGRYRLVILGAPWRSFQLASFVLAPDRELDLGTLQVPALGVLELAALRDESARRSEVRWLLERRADFTEIEALVGEFPPELQLMPGTYTLQVELMPGPLHDTELEIRPGERTHLRIDLSRRTPHFVRLRGAWTGPIHLSLARVDQEAMHVIRTVGADESHGDIEVSLDPGRWIVTATDATGRAAEASFDLFTSRPGRVLELVLE